MNKLFLDIETIPVEKEKHPVLKDVYDRAINDGKKPGTFEEYVLQTSFDGAFGRIACISYAINDGKTTTFFGDEKKIVEDFWDVAKDATLFIGFNVMDFDLRFIYQRSVVLGVKPSIDLNFARYRREPIFDVMKEWNKWGNTFVSLDTLAKALGLPSSKDGEITGKNVAKAFEDGRIKEICEYCEKDVELTRKIYNRLTFSG